MKTQIGKSAKADHTNLWSFRMQEGFKVSAGYYAILLKEDYDELISALKSIRNSVAVHPDCINDSEFEDMVSICDDVLEKIKD